ncbi:Protein kinase domain-containing protein isoform 1 [Venturia nashicola]|uniref:non-specific serine/threonine protein kinase n=1 Tax=Venturia nashicola TaxID=86259 RepID=A0A4Z1NJQ4_9PEZI|nr:Protein kinase domain-containing protein isoform 1 [Venturia nashicola]TLD20996.1 Protein kinase domain-containing protein isoform 1 [Venturia nashicola]
MSQHHEQTVSLPQEFKQKLELEWKQKAVCEGHYVLTQPLKRWMNEREDGLATNCARLLQIAFAKHTRSPHQPLQASQVCNDADSCCLVFSILLDIGYPDLLDIFHAAKIFDHQLSSAGYYYSELRERLAAASYAPEETEQIVNAFNENKRAYCIAELKQRSDSFHKGKWILPICKKERINSKGGTAAIWLILVKGEVLPEELKDKVPHAATEDPDFGLCYQFVLKEYPSENEDSYKWETQAFQLFLGQEGMVQYLGDFTYDDKTYDDKKEKKYIRTFNLLLEYGEQDLDEFFFGERPPRGALATHKFWSALFEVAKALARVHNLRLRYDDGRDQHICGWHADVKPDNILRVRGSFVLADFGFARFQKKAENSNGEPAQETFIGGTDTYGAPETDAIRRGQTTLRSVMQTIDIWSFGCVLSTAASWVVFGLQGIRDYEAVRRKATAALSDDNLPGPVANDAFHNGIKILPEVLTWHDYLRENLRNSDVTTESVLNLIEKHMLLEDPGSRIDSARLCSKLAEIVESSKQKVDQRSSPMTDVLGDLLSNIDAFAMDSDATSQPTQIHDAVELAPRNSLFVPSASARFNTRPGSPSVKQVKKSQRMNAIPHLKTSSQNTRPLGAPSQNMSASSIPTQRSLSMSATPNPILYIKEASDSSQFPITESPQNESASNSITLPPFFCGQTVVAGSEREVNLPSVQGHRFEETYTNPTRPLPNTVQLQESNQEHQHISDQIDGLSEDLFNVTFERSGNGEAPADSSGPTTLVSTTSTSFFEVPHDITHNPSLTFSDPAVAGENSTDPSSLRHHGGSMSANSALPHTKAHSPYLNTALDIVQVRLQLDAKIEKTSHKLREKFRKIKVDPHLENYIKDRDIAFVVDNGTTMVEHWKDVLFTLETLYLKIDGLDKNGVDLRFTDRNKSNCNKAELKKSGGRTMLVRSMNKAQPLAANMSDERVRTNMKEVLSPILQKFFASRQNKRMTLIVLTDGMWEGSVTEQGVAEKIRDFYKSWHDMWHIVEDRWFSIQFVSFGNNAAALHRLQVLDDEMGVIYKIPQVQKLSSQEL